MDLYGPQVPDKHLVICLFVAGGIRMLNFILFYSRLIEFYFIMEVLCKCSVVTILIRPDRFHSVSSNIPLIGEKKFSGQ